MKRARGFSLIELMVAITLALIVTAGVISVFVGSRSAFNATSGTAALTDGGRFALNFISDSVRGAGNMACMRASGLQSILNVAGSPLTSASSFGQALGGYEAVVAGNAYNAAPWPVAADGNNGDWVGGLDAALTGLVIQNNDVLVVRSTLGNAASRLCEHNQPQASIHSTSFRRPARLRTVNSPSFQTAPTARSFKSPVSGAAPPRRLPTMPAAARREIRNPL